MADSTKAVFLSYAREDTEAARRIADALRSSGIEVWFDQSELRGGDAWDQKIRGQIADCTLFLPVVSRHTQERSKGYFRLEWKLAVEQTHLMAEGVPFLAPIVIDETTESGAVVPPEFLRVQWTRLPGALPTPQFVGQVQRLLSAPTAATQKTEARTAPAVASTAATPAKPGLPTWVFAALGVAVLALVGYIALRPAAKEAPAPAKPVAETKAVPPATAKVADASAVALAKADKSIAVLPFTNMSDEKDASAFFSDGVHEDILTNLALIHDLKVVSRTTVTQYRDSKKTMKQIGEELGVAYILEGSVRRAGNKVRVTGQLINARTDEHVWAKSYDRDLTDVFAIQASLSQEIASALQVAITPLAQKFMERRPTENPVAYDAFLKGRQTRDNARAGRTRPLREAETLFKTAVEQDPKFAAAWGELAVVHARTVFWEIDHTPARAAEGDTAIANAVRIAPDAPDVIRLAGEYAYYAHRDFGKALAQYEKLARLQPNDPTLFSSLGLVQRRQGKWAESLVNLRKATELEPGNLAYARNLVSSLQHLRRWPEAVDAQRRVVALAAGNVGEQSNLAGYILEATGSKKETDDLFERIVRPNPDSPQRIYLRIQRAALEDDYAEFKRLDAKYPTVDWGPSSWFQALTAAVVYAAHGDMTTTRARLTDSLPELRSRLESEPNNSRAHLNLGMAEALLGHRDEAIRLAEQAAQLMPEASDAIDGPIVARQVAQIALWTGDKERALAALAHLLRAPTGNMLSVRTLRTDPWFAPLRGDPRFEALLNDPKNNAPLL